MRLALNKNLIQTPHAANYRRLSNMANVQKASFGAGCFWGVEKFFKKEFPKLKSTAVGYMGGTLKNPSYEAVCTGKTGHAEVLQVEYDPSQIKYSDLVHFFYRMHDPTTANRQGNDVGTQYRSVIFYHTPEQQKVAQEVTAEISAAKKFKDPIVTEIAVATEFYRGEDYHQLYLEKNPFGYCNHKLRW